MIQRLALENNVTSSFRLNPGPDLFPRTPDSRLGGGRREALVLPPAREIRPLVDCYFQYFHALTPILHEPTIRAQLTGALPLPTCSGSRVLFNMIFAMGACDYATDNEPLKAGFQYYELARAALQHDLLEGGSLLLLQGLAIMAIYLQRNDKPNTSYICLGLAIRIAIALGLHVSTPSGNGKGLTVLESEMRCRIWWGLVTLETGMCMTYGRPHTLSLPSLFSVRLPLNTEDEYLTVSSAQKPPDMPGITRYTPLIKQARLAQMALHSLDRISRSLPSPTVEQIKWCGDYFRDQLAALPNYMQTIAPPPDGLAWAIQTWRARDYMSIIYRPVFISAAWSSGGKGVSDKQVGEIVDTCRTLAMENLRDIAQFVRGNPDPRRGCEWYTLYFGIQASLTLLLSIVWDPRHPCATSWREHIMDTMAWLRQLWSLKPLGMAWVQIMENVLSARPGPQLGCPTEGQQPLQVEENLVPDIDTFDFERYFSEIWDDQAQTTGLTSEFGLSIWEDTVMGLPGAFH
ncbi:Fungal-specific transcription factor domain-containing protein [Fusarium sp. Ph1]|nr:Fungal-specific transcription factor domain-containing protein [Fusarium sp. Ph1]